MNVIEQRKKKERMINREWYSLRSLLGNDWALFYMLIGGREIGKSYAVTNLYVHQFIKYGRPFYWFRLTDKSQSKLLNNNAEKLVDPDLRRKYNLDLITSGTNVYNVTRDKKGKVKTKQLMARVLALSTFYNDKGSGYFDKDFLNDPKMYYNICLDEMNREKDEKRSFDIVYAFTNQLENIVRSTKTRMRVICIGNLLEEASDLLCAFDFIPEDFGRYKLKKKRCVIEYIPNSEKYLARRKGTVADILMPTASTFTNKIDSDNTLVYKGRCSSPSYVIKFSKDELFTIWDSHIVRPFNNEKVRVVAMRPYLDVVYNSKEAGNIFQQFDQRIFLYKDLITFKQFQKNLSLLKPRSSG